MAARHSATQFRLLAGECVEQARHVDSYLERRLLLERASCWRRLAAGRDREAQARRPARQYRARPAGWP